MIPSQVSVNEENGARRETADVLLGVVRVMYPRRGEVWLGTDPLSFVYLPRHGEFDRKRSREVYHLPYGTHLTLCDGFTRQIIVVASGVTDGAVQMKAARALGAVVMG